MGISRLGYRAGRKKIGNGTTGKGKAYQAVQVRDQPQRGSNNNAGDTTMIVFLLQYLAPG